MAQRIVFVGASPVTVLAARKLLEAGHEVVVIEQDAERIEELKDTLDCGFVHGDGSRPGVLEDVGLRSADHFFCISGSDQDNILASLVARSMKIEHVVTKIEDPDYELLCRQLGLQDTIVPDRELAGQLVDMVSGREPALAAALEGHLRFFTFVVSAKGAGPIDDLDLPEGCRAVAVTRDGESSLAEHTELKEKDRVLVIAEEAQIDELKQRFTPASEE